MKTFLNVGIIDYTKWLATRMLRTLEVFLPVYDRRLHLMFTKLSDFLCVFIHHCF